MNVIQCLKEGGDVFDLVTEHKSESLPSSYCMICFEPANDPPFYFSKALERSYSCVIHKSCGELPGEITNHPLHPPHPLKISHFLSKSYIMYVDMACDVCFTINFNLKYRCETCKENICHLCISKYGTEKPKQKVEKFTPYHLHQLRSLYFSERPYPSLQGKDFSCCCCEMDISTGFGYSCLECGFHIHESCSSAAIPREIRSSFHPQHSLKFKHHSPNPYADGYCIACQREIRQVELRCRDCDCSFHVSCGLYTLQGFRVNDGDYTLFYINDYFDREGFEDFYCCGICDEMIYKGPMYRLVESKKNFHVECIVPNAVDHPCHYHQLKLTSSVERQTEAEKYRCDVCEEEEDFEHYVYHCEDECDFNAHIECLFTQEDNPLKIELFQHAEKVKNVCSKEQAEKFSIDTEVEDTEYEEYDQENENGEKKFNLENSYILELREKMSGLIEQMKPLYKEIENLTAEFNMVKSVYETKIKGVNRSSSSH